MGWVNMGKSRSVESTKVAVVARIEVNGNPNRMVLDRAGRYLFVAEDNSDSVDIIDTQSNKVAKSIKIAGSSELVPDRLLHYRGLSPTSLALSSDALPLYVT